MSGNDKKSVAERFTAKAPPLEVIEGGKPQAGKQPYKAYGIDKPNNRTERIDICYHDADNRRNSPAKSYLVNIDYSAGKYLALIFTTCVYMLEGEYLEAIYQRLNDNEVESLHCFNPKLHEAPEPETPILTRIQMISSAEAESFGEG